MFEPAGYGHEFFLTFRKLPFFLVSAEITFLGKKVRLCWVM
jgi:hypothetical protein